MAKIYFYKIPKDVPQAKKSRVCIYYCISQTHENLSLTENSAIITWKKHNKDKMRVLPPALFIISNQQEDTPILEPGPVQGFFLLKERFFLLLLFVGGQTLGLPDWNRCCINTLN